MSTNTVPAVANTPPPAAASVDYEAQWLAERSSFIGGSEAFELMNELTYGKGCQRALAYRKTGEPPDYPEQLDDEVMLRGHILEPVAAAKYQELTGRKMRRGPSGPGGLPKVERHPDYPWAGVHVDRTILAGSGDRAHYVEETGDAEIKSMAEGHFLHTRRKGLPQAHRLQLSWANFVKRHTWGAFVIIGLTSRLDLIHFDVPADPEMVSIFKREGDRFWNTLAKGQLPPPPFASDDVRCHVCPFRMTCRGEELDKTEAALIKAEKSGKKKLVQIADPEVLRNLHDLTEVQLEKKALEETEDTIKGKIIEALAGTPDALVGGQFKVYTADGKWSGIDQGKLKSDHPEVYDQVFVSGRATGKKTIRVYPA